MEERTADLSTVTAAADRVFHIGGTEPWLLHLEFQSGRDDSLIPRILKYNALLWERYDEPVHSVVILLRPQAMWPALNGTIHYQARPELGGMDFHYALVRVWEWPVEALLSGGLGTLPIAPLSAQVDRKDLPAVIRRMDERIRRKRRGKRPSSGPQPTFCSAYASRVNLARNYYEE